MSSDLDNNTTNHGYMLDEWEAFDTRRPPKVLNYLNLASNMIYFMNFFIIIPSVNEYLVGLGYDESLSGLLIALGPACGALATVLIYSRILHLGTKPSLLLAAFTGFVGNSMYALASTADSIGLLIAGRLLCGFATCTCAVRCFLTKHNGRKVITAANAQLTVVTALGAAVGPLIAATLSFVDFSIGKVSFQDVSAPGWFMALVYVVLLLLLGLFFEDLPQMKEPETIPLMSKGDLPETVGDSGTDLGGAKEVDKGEMEGNKGRKKKRDSPLTFGITLSFLFLTKFAMGTLETAAPLISKTNWGLGIFVVSLILAGANFCVLPVTFIVRKLSLKYGDDKLISWFLPTQLVVFALLVDYGFGLSIPRYVLGMCVFVFANQALESVVGGLFYKSVPSYMLFFPFSSAASYTAIFMALGRASGAVWGAGMVIPSSWYSLDFLLVTVLILMLIPSLLVLIFFAKLKPLKRD
eukprot:Nk52_evm4s235 gene=Nk52_evmTU4s235